jgi:exonuclease III
MEYSSLNVNGISHKLEELQMELISKKMDIAVLVEIKNSKSQ